ncbi:MAG: glycosyltransferase family 4 protein [Spirochaetales bacterium]|nr:glycosyltransferase family 4 protein [Spirochaetales bacterium]
MKILWITNFVLHSSGLGGSKKVLSGTWLEAMLRILTLDDGIELHVGMFAGRSSPPQTTDGINYYWIKATRQFFSYKSNFRMRKTIEELIETVSPDIVHIQGTEFPRCEAVIDSCRKRNIKVIASIQGLISVISNYYLAEVSAAEWLRRSSFRDFLLGYTIPRQAYFCRMRGEAERSMIIKLDAVLGRTDWDRAHVREIAPETDYFHSPELLRPEFYNNKWILNQTPVLLTGNMSSPLKGLHTILRALKLLQRDYPEIKLRIIGENLYEPSKFKRKLIKKSYINYISRLIENLRLNDCVEWLGPCNAEQIIAAMNSSSIYIQASSIENSPNSLIEALQIGMPVVASGVGGTLNMLEHGKDGFIYRSGDEALLSYYVSKLLGSKSLLKQFSEYSYNKNRARLSSGKASCSSLLDIYSGLINGGR